MSTNRQIPSSLLLATILLGGILYAFGCNGGGSVDPPPVTGDYRLEGVLIVDRNSDSTHAAAKFSFKNTVLANSIVALKNDTLSFNSPNFPVASVHSFSTGSFRAYLPGGIILSLSDSTIFSQTVAVTVTDSFSITNVIPPTRLLQGNGQVSLEWNSAANVDGFVLVAVHEDSLYLGQGYSAYATSGVTSGTIPPDAFLGPNGLDPTVGLYYLYVYAFNGAPDSALSHLLLPAPLPDQLADNVTSNGFSARFGTVVISAFDTVRVVQQP